MHVRLNLQGYITADITMEAAPRVGDGIDYTDMHEGNTRHLRGVVNHVHHIIGGGSHVVVVACSAREVE